jgi:hypothetical protein
MYDHEITCSECGTRHGLRKVSIPVRDKDSIDCLKCGNKDPRCRTNPFVWHIVNLAEINI